MKVRLSPAVRGDLDLHSLVFQEKLKGRGGVGQKKEVDLMKEIHEDVFAFNLA